MTRIATVFGATGTQGSSVVTALLEDGTFIPRAISRNPNSDVSKKLAALGVEVVKADLWDKESIKKALNGSECVFGVTNFFDPSVIGANPSGEIDQGKYMVDAAKEVGVKFLVWSSLPDTAKISNGKYPGPGIRHFTNKAAIEEYLKASGLPSATLHLGYYAENLTGVSPLTKVADGSYELKIPKFQPASTQPFAWVEQALGVSVLALFKNYQSRKEEILGRVFYVVTARVTFSKLAEIVEKAIGKPVKFISIETCGNEELDEMYQYQNDGKFLSDREVPDPDLVALGVKFATLEEFAEKYLKPRLT
ncbi:hypothetical protein PILCRDRAFT_828638 [Piloderma croceum F 1598]|uniref:NmrA-like domain-containing protein n=1 Tax=Piloderma croceum (strain F 1598) TaxID=765440 RepID=A0A0C3B9I9_PILCF|nr:hypothetical protein PILCRDRAFT_828638 [Piloderma croceum F 1598]